MGLDPVIKTLRDGYGGVGMFRVPVQDPFAGS